MRHRGDPLRLVNLAQHVHGRGADAFDERRTPARQPAIERLGDGRHVPTGNQRARDPRPAGRLAVVVGARAQHGLGVEMDSMPRQTLDDAAQAIDAHAARLGEKHAERRGGRIEEVAEDVHVGAVNDRGDLDAGHELDAGLGARGGDRRAGGRGVVVGDAQHLDAGRRRTGDELARRAPSIGRSRVGVEIDQRRDFAAAGRGVRAVRVRRPWRARSARYSLMRRSRCSRSSSANSRKICLPSESSKRSP